MYARKSTCEAGSSMPYAAQHSHTSGGVRSSTCAAARGAWRGEWGVGRVAWVAVGIGWSGAHVARREYGLRCEERGEHKVQQREDEHLQACPGHCYKAG